jgi:hypothetical protein
MARVDVDQTQVLDSFMELLRLELPLTDRTCYITLDPPGQLAFIPASDWWITVSPGEGVFVDGEQSPGNITEDFSVTVTIYSRIRLDQAGRDTSLVLDGVRGLYPLKQRVLAATVGRELRLTWKDEDVASTFLRAFLNVVHATAPQVAVSKHDGHLSIAYMALTYRLPFDWDLTVKVT